MKKLPVREAQREDMPEVASLFKKSRNHFLPYLPTLHTEEEDREIFTKEVFEKDRVWLAEDPRTKSLAGFIAFNREMINHLYLLPGYERRGIGTKLLKIAQKESKKLRLWTFQKNIAAIAFYQRHGFETIRTSNGIDNEEKEPDVLMEWSLD